jgi:hypothetical protein
VERGDQLILAPWVLLWQRVLMQSADGASATGAAFDLLQSFQQAPLVDGEDSIRQLRSIMTAVVALGRQWVPSGAIAPGSFVELTDGELLEVAGKEHSRDRDYVRTQLAQLEAVGLMPVLPECGPPGAADFLRIGEVRAKRLTTRRPWRNRSGDELAGAGGDWYVIDESGDERTVRDLEFQQTHERLGGDRWRRTGTVRAWQVGERVVLRTLEGRAAARPGDWIVQGPRSVRWPVRAEQLARGYRRVSPGSAEPAAG